jgi:hypothetical protein
MFLTRKLSRAAGRHSHYRVHKVARKVTMIVAISNIFALAAKACFAFSMADFPSPDSPTV